MTKSNYDSIDLMKFIACIMVVMIHSDPFQDISPYMNRLVSAGLCRLAVPLYFISSSFFFFRKGNPTKDILIKYLKRLGTMYLAWFIIALPVTLFNHFSGGVTFVGIMQFVKSFFVTSTFSGSWFLTACAFSATISYLICKSNKSYSIFITVSIPVYLFCVFTSAWGNIMNILDIRHYYEIFRFYFAKPYISILTGIPYFALGKFFAEREGNILKPNIFIVLFLLLHLLIEITASYYLKMSNSTDCYLMLLPCSCAIFAVLINSNINIRFAATLRKTSTLIYFSQFIWLFVIEFAEWILYITIPQIYKCAIAIVLCILTSWAVLKLQGMINFKWLRFLY